MIYFLNDANNIYLQSIYSHSAWNLIEDALFTSGVCVQHCIQACKRGSPTAKENTMICVSTPEYPM